MPFNPPEAWKNASPVERAAHLYESFEPPTAGRMCTEEGISEADAIAGIKLADERRREWLLNREFYGATEHGGRR